MTQVLQSALLVILCFAVTFTGCANLGGSNLFGGGASPAVASGGGGGLAVHIDPTCQGCQEGAAQIQQAGSKEERVARWVLFGLIITALVVIDILLLPAYHHRHSCFPCTRTVVVWCH